MNTVDCNKCGYSFVPEDACCGTIEEGDLLVVFLLPELQEEVSRLYIRPSDA